jgi:hypothetical protein
MSKKYYQQHPERIVRKFMRGRNPDKIAYDLWDVACGPSLEEVKRYVWRVIRDALREADAYARA